MKKLILLLSCLYSLSTFAKDTADALDQVFLGNDFRVFYTLNGKNALSERNQQDANGNNTPDFVEKIAQKLQSATAIYTQQFHLQHPLTSERYRGRAAFIDVYILALDGNGSAGDEVIPERFPSVTHSNHAVLSIKILNSLSASNHTPEHELFHIFQNGYSMFKNRWYTEGTARWVEQAFFDEAEENAPLPASSSEFEDLLQETYGAKLFWNRITYLCDADSPANNPAATARSIYGSAWIKTLLEHLAKSSLTASQARHFPPYQWPEEEQKRNRHNNGHLLRAIKQATLQHCPKPQLASAELTDFFSALDAQLATYPAEVATNSTR